MGLAEKSPYLHTEYEPPVCAQQVRQTAYWASSEARPWPVWSDEEMVIE